MWDLNPHGFSFWEKENPAKEKSSLFLLSIMLLPLSV